MKLLAMILVLVSGNALAVGYQEFNSRFTIPVISDVGTRVYYNCDSVEDRVEAMLEQMGAQNIRVRCTGGLDRFNGRFSTAARVRASYEALSTDVDGGNTTVSIFNETLTARGTNCHLVTRAFRAVSKNFEITSAELPRCRRSSRARARINFEVLKEVR